MVKKKIEPTPAPVITSLPMASADSPLVIDLPDGQKLVVGTMAAGTVIEVATWRGTGRPDSRTSRLMLGMSTNDAPSQNSSTNDSPAQESSHKQLPKNKYLAIVMGLLNSSLSALKKFMAGGPKKPKAGSKPIEDLEQAPTSSRKPKFKFSLKKAASPLNKISSKKSEDLADKEFQTWAQPCIPPNLGHSIWLVLTFANIYSATKVDNVPPTKMEAPVISEVLEA